ncbi:phosphoribosylanthranilate isomerase [Brotaphodocola sp.]|uniref:phosphoribosylanthranilate isomerase n=1 Tax=Brotaphodocola sp. TaxID=3073577 RepID=UPI003D7C4AC3
MDKNQKHKMGIENGKAGTGARRTRVKICGLTREEDMDVLNECRPDFAGLVFAPSRRQVSEEQAEKLRARLRPEIPIVGVFVDAPSEQIARLVEKRIIDVVQLHGSETPSDLENLRERLKGLGRKVPLIKAIRMSAETDLAIWDQSEADYLLLDAMQAGAGKVFDHNLLESHLPIRKPWFLAGGMNPENVSLAIARFSPFGVDVSSGVETDGKKDPEKIRRMIAEVRSHSFD